MIYTVTLNPAIDETLEVEHLRPGATHRVLSRCRYAGGKGINVARALRVFAEDCVALTIAGGTTGQELAGLLRQEELPCTVYAAPHPTRVNLKISSRGDGLTTELNAPGLLGEAAPGACGRSCWSAFCRGMWWCCAAVCRKIYRPDGTGISPLSAGKRGPPFTWIPPGSH